jgi:curved DNA-binding protein CbpA
MKKTLYDLLELSPQASEEAIRAAYERLATRYDPASPANRDNPDAAIHYQLIKDAFLTLANPTLRAGYDTSMQARRRVEPAPGYALSQGGERFWTPAKLFVLLVAVAAGGAYYYKGQHDAAVELARLQAEARRAELDAERLRSEQAEASRSAQLDSQQRADFERFKREAEANSRRLQAAEDSQRQRDAYGNRQQDREADAQRRRDEMEARRRAEREIAEARRLDYERSAPRAVSISR